VFCAPPERKRKPKPISFKPKQNCDLRTFRRNNETQQQTERLFTYRIADRRSDAAIAIPNLLRARMAANESSAAGSLRTINTSEVTYYTTYAWVSRPCQTLADRRQLARRLRPPQRPA
jgi:hypothetical protein